MAKKFSVLVHLSFIFHIHKSPPLDHKLSQLPASTFTPHFSKIHVGVTLCYLKYLNISLFQNVKENYLWFWAMWIALNRFLSQLKP